jgi:hypothetical protein
LLNTDSNSTRLNDEEVELIYNSGAQRLKSFAGRLFKRYFTSAELSAEDISFCGSDTKKPLDPMRIDFIKSHLVDRTQGQLTEMEWYECKRYLYILLFNARKGAGVYLWLNVVNPLIKPYYYLLVFYFILRPYAKEDSK